MKRLMTIAAVCAAFALGACETNPFHRIGGVGAGSSEISLRRQLDEAQARNEELARELARADGGVESASFGTAEYPANAQPGQCFARMLTPETTRVVTERVEASPETEEVRVIPAVYDWAEESVLVREERTVLETIPAITDTVTERVLVEEESVETTVVPAVYENYDERVLVREAYTTWKPGTGLYGASGETRVSPTGEILCRVEVPAEYRTVTRQRLVTAEHTEERVIPARYDTVTREVVVEPARVVERVIPAEYDTVRVRRVVEPAREERVAHPAVFRDVERTEVVAGEKLEWHEVLCDTNANRAVIADVQRALAAAGHSPGPIDGAFGPRTASAMIAYQRANGLLEGHLTRETIEHLGVDFTPHTI